MNNIVREMLLIEEPSVLRLYKEMIQISGYFVGPLFIISLILEFLGNLDFGGVVKRLLVVMVVLTSFQTIHIKAVDVSLDTASVTLKKVSPNNLFVKKWYEGKIKTKEKKGWGYLESFAIPNLNDLLATAFFLLAKVFTWLLKLIYSSVYHLTYIFSGITALLYFFGWTNRSLIGTFQSSLWCIILPFVIVAILAMVGNSINQRAINGELAIADIETILWLFGVTLILLLTPVITWSMVKGDGVAGAGSKMGSIAVSSGMKAIYMLPMIYSRSNQVRKVASNSIKTAKSLVSKSSDSSQFSNLKEQGVLEKESFLYDKSYWNKINENHRSGIREKYGIQTPMPEKGIVYFPKDAGKNPIPLKTLIDSQKSKTLASNNLTTKNTNSIKQKEIFNSKQMKSSSVIKNESKIPNMRSGSSEHGKDILRRRK